MDAQSDANKLVFKLVLGTHRTSPFALMPNFDERTLYPIAIPPCPFMRVERVLDSQLVMVEPERRPSSRCVSISSSFALIVR